MVEQENDQSDADPSFKMYSQARQALATALRRPAAVSNQSPLRPVYCLFSLAIVAGILVLRYAAFLSSNPGAGVFSLYPFSSDHAAGGSPDFPVLDSSTLVKLAESEVGEDDLRREIALLLEGNFAKLSHSTPFLIWRRSFLPVDVHSPSFHTLYAKFRPLLSDWSDRSRANRRRPPGETLTELVALVGRREKYSSCAVVGNSGILLNAEHGGAIDGHEAVIRLNNARIAGFSKNVGSKTTISFLNSNIVHLCARRRDCFCHPYGAAVSIVLYICQPIHFLDFAACNATTHANGRAPFLVTDPGFDALCSKIVKYYSLEKWFGAEDGRNRTLQGWTTVHEGPFFHYSSGMQAVLMAVGVCEKVSLFGFGKAATAKHHYHTNQKAELQLHDYEAEYNFYKDLADRPHSIPFLSGAEFQFPPVEIHH